MTVSISSSAAIARAALLAAALGDCLRVGSATAEDALAPLKGQTIRYIIGGSAGGGTDQMGRMFATALRRALPDTEIHIQNIRGASGGLPVAEVANATGGLVTMTFPTTDRSMFSSCRPLRRSSTCQAQMDWFGR